MGLLFFDHGLSPINMSLSATRGVSLAGEGQERKRWRFIEDPRRSPDNSCPDFDFLMVDDEREKDGAFDPLFASKQNMGAYNMYHTASGPPYWVVGGATSVQPTYHHVDLLRDFLATSLFPNGAAFANKIETSVATATIIAELKNAPYDYFFLNISQTAIGKQLKE